MSMKSAKELVHFEYPDLNLDFLKVEDTHSGTTNLGAEGQKIAPAKDEAVDQATRDNKDGDGAVDIHLLDE